MIICVPLQDSWQALLLSILEKCCELLPVDHGEEKQIGRDITPTWAGVKKIQAQKASQEDIIPFGRGKGQRNWCWDKSQGMHEHEQKEGTRELPGRR